MKQNILRWVVQQWGNDDNNILEHIILLNKI